MGLHVYHEFHMEFQRTQLTKIILKKINKFEGLTSDDFNTYSEVTGIKRM